MKRILITILTLIPLLVMSQPGGMNPNGGADPDAAPIGGIGVLILSGALFGARHIYITLRRRK